MFTKFATWLRSNSEHYLLQDAQARLADRTNFPGPRKPQTLKDRFFRRVFAPIYRKLPAGLRTRTIKALPGSHKKEWPENEYESQQPAI